jgi:hypothetical protein
MFLVVGVAAVFGTAASTGAADYGSYPVLTCSTGSPLCPETNDSIGLNGAYTGHDEPSLLFYSNTAGSGNSNTYRFQLPSDPKAVPKQDGSGATWNFQLHPAFWFGMALCDDQSGPEFTHTPCTPDSDTNIFDGTNPAGSDYIGKHPGVAFLEVQFYPPGWAPLPSAVSCDGTQWCAAMAIFSFNSDQNAGVNNNRDCLGKVGLEPVSYAFITTNGVPHSSPAPLEVQTSPFSALTPNAATDLFMNSGDVVTADIHDGPAGLVATLNDLTTHQSGSMTASAANGFAHILYEPTSSACHEAPYTYRPMYSTSSEHTRVTWAAHTYNVAFSDEIGHFEYCSSVNDAGNCLANNEAALDADDQDGTCFGPDDSLFAPVGGCVGFINTDGDFDGVSYQPVWPGAGKKDDKNTPTPIVFTSPLFNGTQNYDRVAFETDLPRIEAPDSGGNCNRFTGENCVNPPPGSNFYPIYTTGSAKPDFFNVPGKTDNPAGPKSKGGCVWQFGGAGIKGTTNDFGGTSAAEYGTSPLFSFYPNPNPAIRLRTNNFRTVLDSNPCPA